MSLGQLLERIKAGAGHTVQLEGSESIQEVGMALADRWSKFPGKLIEGFKGVKEVNFMQGVTDPWKRSLTAYMLENAYQHYAKMNETTRTLAVGNYEKYVFPIIRMVFANLVASDLVSVQPLTGPTGLIFYYDAIAGTTKGNITKGTKLYDAKAGPNNAMHYSDELIEEEAYATGADDDDVNGTLSWIPIRPGSVKITDGTQIVTDDGNGSLVGDVGASSTINYATGAVVLKFASNVTSGTAVTATYEYNAEGHTGTPEIEINLTSSPVMTRENKLRVRWSMEAEQDLMASHGMTAETEHVTMMTNRISQEINTKIIRHIRQVAPNTPVTFDITPPSGVSYRDHKEILVDAFTETSNDIFVATQRVNATWLIISTEVANIVETLTPHFVKIPAPSGVSGIRKIGTLGDVDVYKDPSYPAGEWLMGYKGGSFLDTGYVHAVYQGLVSTPSITLDDFVTRKGLMSRTAQKVVNERFYARGTLSGTGPVT